MKPLTISLLVATVLVALTGGQALAVQRHGVTLLKEATVPVPVVALGAMQVEVDYSGAGGGFVGLGEQVSCRRDISAGGIAAFNNDPAAQTLFLGFANNAGYANRLNLATCVFEKADGAPAPVASDFTVTVPLAGDLDLNIVNAQVVISDIELCACGDGVVTCLEDCDDGNTNSGDGCGQNCQCENMCGDGNLESPCEQCDPGGVCKFGGEPAGTFCTYSAGGPECNQGGVCVFNENAGCNIDCQLEGVCGDATLQPDTEQCDDGNASNEDGCLNDCTLSFCGDGFVHTGVEECDDGNGDDGDDCLTDCSLASCGDGFVEAGVEQCDDGNIVDGDCCSMTCEIENTPGCQPVACGDADGSGAVNATDSLSALQTAVGSGTCPQCICDVDPSTLGVVATDAFVILQFGVGQGVTLECPACQ